MSKEELQTVIKSFNKHKLLDSSKGLYNSLGFKFEVIAQGNENLVLDKIDSRYKDYFEDTRLLFQFDKNMLREPSLEGSQDKFDNLLFVAISLGDEDYFNKSKLANMVRALNRSGWPIVVLFYNKGKLSIGLTELRKHKKDVALEKNFRLVAEKVTLIRDIDTNKPHAGHISILSDCFAINKKMASLDELHAHWQEKLSQELLTKQFYNELKGWYEYARNKIKVPLTPKAINKKVSEDTYKAESLIRLITRLIFVWFLREVKDPSSKEGLVSEGIFNEDILNELNTNKDQSSYYKAILQNLFFATLNKHEDTRSISDLCYYDLFKEGVEYFYKNYFSQTPFLNGGLFQPLSAKDNDGLWDDYFTDDNNDLHIGNELFFGDDTHKGLYKILEQYKFTISENSSIDNEIALDPELLGKVFEELLSSYVDEVSGDKNDKKKNTGSYYTPREVVDYMVGESLYSTVKDIIATEWQEQSFKAILKGNYEETNSFNPKEKKELFERLENLKIIDPACGSGAFPMGILLALDNAISCLKNDGKADYDRKLEIIKNNIYGVDIQPIAIQISKLRVFISLLCSEDFSKKIEPLPNLETRLVVANTLNKIERNLFNHELFDKIAKIRTEYITARPEDKAKLQKQDDELRDTEDKLSEVASWSPYKIDQSADFFDPKIMFGLDNFDLVIGNPPYIQLQKLKAKGYPFDTGKYPNTFTATGDIYSIFYERAYGLLKKEGICCFITSNKWMRAGYGESLRGFLATKTTPLQLIDLGSGVFESATVDSNILIYKKEVTAGHSLAALKLEKGVLLEKLKRADFTKLSDLSEESWLILSPAEGELKKKIETKGKALKKWGVNINRGVLTGYNEAFIIEQAKYDELVAKDPKNKEVLKPLLRGKDIARYEAKWAKLYLVATHNGYGGKPRINIDDYPAVKEHLDQHWPKVEKRLDQGDTPYNLRNCTYYEEFNKPKIIYPSMTSFLPFTYDDECFYTNDKCFIITSANVNLLYLVGYMNSKVSHYWIRQNCPNLGDSGNELRAIFFENLPIPLPSPSQEEAITNLVNQIIEAKKQGLATSYLESEIDELVYGLYGLSEEEIKIVESN